MISDRLLKTLGKPISRAKGSVKLAGSEAQLDGGYWVDSLSLGGVHFQKFWAAHFKSPYLDEIAVDEEIDGLLGLGLFADCLLTLDYPTRTLILAQGKLPPKDGLDILPYELKHGIPHIDILAGGTTLRMAIDSGGGFIDVAADDLKGLPIHAGPIRLPGSQSLYVRAKCDFSIGRHVVSCPLVSSSKGFERTLGARLLQQFSVTFDQTQRLVRFTREGDKPVYNGTLVPTFGVAFTREGPDWTVTDAVPELLGGVDIQIGDRILAVDGHPVAEAAAGECLKNPSVTLALARGEKRWQAKLTATIPLPPPSK